MKRLKENLTKTQSISPKKSRPKKRTFSWNLFGNAPQSEGGAAVANSKPWFLNSPEVPDGCVYVEAKNEQEENDLSGSMEEFTIQDDEENQEDSEELKSTMEKIPPCQVTQWKHVLYNLLVDNHNSPKVHTFCRPYTVRKLDEVIGTVVERKGFRFDVKQNPSKKLAEMWALYEKRKDLSVSTLPEVFKVDIYKSYLRSCLDLMAKYFEKEDKWTFLYYETPLFLPNETLCDGLARLKILPAKGRKDKTKKNKRTTCHGEV